MEISSNFGAETVEARAPKVYHDWRARITANAEEVMSCLLGMQWLSAVFALLTATWYWRISPVSSLLPIWLAMTATACSGLPLLLMALKKRRAYGRYAIALGQVVWSLLLIELSGHRIETYAHLFGSLLLLSLFNDIRVLAVSGGVVFAHIGISNLSGREGAPVPAAHEAFWVLLCLAWLGHRTQRQNRAARRDARSQAKRDLRLQSTGRDLSENNRQLNYLHKALDTALVDPDGERCLIDNRGNVMSANSLWRERWGEPPRANLLEISQRTPGPWGLAAGKIEAALRAAIEVGTPYQGEVAYDDRQLLRIEIRPLLGDAPHDPVGAMVIQRNITAEASLQQRLEECRAELQRTRAAAEHSEDAIAMLDEQGRIEDVCGEWEHVTGWTLGAVRGERLHRVLARANSDGSGLQAIDACLEQRQGCDAVFECERPDGSRYHARCRIRPLSTEDGQFLGFVAHHRDITQQRSQEEQHGKLQRQITEAAKHAASVAMTHSALEQVSDALTTANVMTGLVLNRVKSFAPTRIEQAGTLIEQHVDDLAAFVLEDNQGRHLPAYLKSLASRISRENNLLKEEIGRLQSGIVAARDLVEEQKNHTRLAPFLEAVAMNEVLRDALLAIPMGDAVEVMEDLDSAVPRLHADRRKLMQIMVNLLSNARNALRICGKAEQRLCVRTFVRDGKAMLEIVDNGCGIPPAQMSRIFRRGYSDWSEGRGYGLFCSRQAAEEMGGELTAHSDGELCGATFRFALPLRFALESAAGSYSADSTSDLTSRGVPALA